MSSSMSLCARGRFCPHHSGLCKTYSLLPAVHRSRSRGLVTMKAPVTLGAMFKNVHLPTLLNHELWRSTARALSTPLRSTEWRLCYGLRVVTAHFWSSRIRNSSTYSTTSMLLALLSAEGLFQGMLRKSFFLLVNMLEPCWMGSYHFCHDGWTITGQVL